MATDTIDLETIRAHLDEACEYAVSHGWTLTPRVTLDYISKKCCPIGALELQGVDSESLSAYILRWSFMDGFDGSKLYYHRSKELHALGQEFRARYVGDKTL